MDSTEANSPIPKKRKWKSEWVVSSAAIFISILTLSVYIYQARIMQRQQATSVWPYIEWTMTYHSEEGIFLSVKNKGVGPALIKKTELQLDGQPMTSVYEMINKLTGNRTDSIRLFTESVQNRVLAPGEEIRLFHMGGEFLRGLQMGKLNDRIKYKIWYCSIYDDCWASTGLKVEEIGKVPM